MQILYIILYKGLEHPRILVSAGVLEPVSCGYQGTAVNWLYLVGWYVVEHN